MREGKCESIASRSRVFQSSCRPSWTEERKRIWERAQGEVNERRGPDSHEGTEVSKEWRMEAGLNWQTSCRAGCMAG